MRASVPFFALLSAFCLNAVADDGLLLRSHFPEKRREQGKNFSNGVSSHILLGTLETRWGLNSALSPTNCGAGSKWRVVRVGGKLVRWAQTAGGAAMLADVGLRAYVYLGLEADPTFSPLLKMALGEDVAASRDRMELETLSEDELKGLKAEQILMGGADLTGYVACRSLPNIGTLNAQSALLEQKLNVNGAEAELSQARFRYQAAKDIFETAERNHSTALQEAKKVSKPSRSGPQWPSGKPNYLVEAEDALKESQKGYWAAAEKTRQASTKLASAKARAMLSKLKFVTLSNGSSFFKAAKQVGRKLFVMDIAGRVYRYDNLEVDPGVSPLAQWTMHDGVPKTKEAIDAVLENGWEIIDSVKDAGANALNGTKTQVNKSKNRFIEEWDGKTQVGVE